jgi:hypothetical protein
MPLLTHSQVGKFTVTLGVDGDISTCVAGH